MRKYQKYLFAGITWICFSNPAAAQDTLFIKNSSDFIVCVIKTVSESEIEYNKISMLSGPVFKIATDRVSKIIYSNGEVEAFETKRPEPKQTRPNPWDQPETTEYFEKGKSAPVILAGTKTFTGFALNGGLGSASQTWTVQNSNVKNPTGVFGFIVGGAVLIKREAGFAISIGVQYASKGYKLEDKVINSTDFDLNNDGVVDPDVSIDFTQTARLNYIELPVLFGKMYPTKNNSGLVWGIGPCLGISLGGKYLFEYVVSGRVNSTDYRYQGNETVKIKAQTAQSIEYLFDFVQPLDLGLYGQVRYIFERKVAIGANFNLGIGNVTPSFDVPPAGYKRGDIIFQNRYFGVTFDVFLGKK